MKLKRQREITYHDIDGGSLGGSSLVLESEGFGDLRLVLNGAVVVGVGHFAESRVEWSAVGWRKERSVVVCRRGCGSGGRCS